MMIRVSTTSQSGQNTDEYELEKRNRTNGKHNLLDRISLLPYEILVTIVSFLSLKEAAATSILSQRWKNLWKYTTSLNFEDVDFFVGDSFHSFQALEEIIRDQKSCKYVDWVDRVLQQHEGHNIERFRAFFYLNIRFKFSIDKWIEFAMEKRVQVLELQLFVQKYDTRDKYAFPLNLLGLGGEGESLKHAELPTLYNNTTGFKFLKVLRFQQINLSDEVLAYFLSNCPVLERLSVTVADDLVCLRVVGPSISLKYLTIHECRNLRSIEICNANIVSFVYRGFWIDLLISNLPLLTEIHISERLNSNRRDNYTALVFNRLSCCLSQLEILKLNIWGVVYNPNYDFHVLENLKNLELNIETNHHWALYHLSSFMKACPHIQRLVLKLDFRAYVSTTVRKATKFPHHSLKVVEIIGYRGYQCAVEHVVYLIESAVALEKIIIDPVRRWIWPPGMDRGAKMVNEELDARKHAMKHLKERVPSTIEFLCL